MNICKRVLGAGSPIVDLLIRIPESFLDGVEGAKGGMELVNSDTIDQLLAASGVPADKAPGGSAANTIFALSRMGMPTAFLGKLGMDSESDYYQEEYRVVGGDTGHFKFTSEAPTARCLSMITPDSQRTMRTDLGAAVLLAPNEISSADFAGFDHAHLEGYLLFNRDLAVRALESAKEAGCTVSLDLGSFEVVRAAMDVLPGLLGRCVDAVFANEDEAAAYFGHNDAEAAARALGGLCAVAAVKMGAQGAWIVRGDETVFCPAMKVENVVDSTGAGDCWAAGFLFGYLNGMPLSVCGELGALLGGEVVQEIGASPSRAGWARIRDRVAAL